MTLILHGLRASTRPGAIHLPSLERSRLIRKQPVGKGNKAHMLIWLLRTAPDPVEQQAAPQQAFVRTDEQERLFDRVQEFISGARIADYQAATEHYGLSAPGPDELIIQGPAGSGKTTVAAQAMLAAGVPYMTSGYTNRCVDVQKRKGLESRTIHSLGYGMTPEGEWTLVTKKTIAARMNYAVILADEASMIDDFYYEGLRQCSNKLILVGDPGQLDPVEGPSFWRDRVPDFRLTRSMRFEDGSEIGRLAKLLWCSPLHDPTITMTSPAWLDGSIDWSEWDTAVCYRNTTRWLLNLGFMGGEWREPQSGDPVMIRYNIPVEGVYNRQLFTVVENRGIEVGAGHEVYEMRLEDADGGQFVKRLLAQGFRDARGESEATATKGVALGGKRWAIPATYGFAHTAHSAQGGEWDRVLVVDESHAIPDRDVASKFLYTAITRAKHDLGITSLVGLLAPSFD